MAKTDETNDIGPRRILAGLGAVADEVQTIDAALALASALRAEVRGHYVEEINLLNFAALPFATAIRAPDLMPRPVALHDMEHEISHVGRVWKRRLNKRAVQTGVEWSFQRSRGEYCAEIGKHLSRKDIVVVNPANVSRRKRDAVATILKTMASASGALVLPPRFQATLGSVVILVKDGMPAATTLHIAHRLASTYNQDLVVVVAAKTSALDDEIANITRDITGRSIKIYHTSEENPDELLEQIASFHPSYVIWQQKLEDALERQVEKFLYAFKAPLLLMRD